MLILGQLESIDEADISKTSTTKLKPFDQLKSYLERVLQLDVKSAKPFADWPLDFAIEEEDGSNNNDSSLSIDVKLPGALRPPLSYQRSDRHTLYLPDCL